MEAWREELHADLYHSFKGQEWKHHKYIRKEGNRYIYPEDVKSSSKSQKGWVSDTVSSVGNAAATVATSVGSAVSTAASNVVSMVSDVWNTVANVVGNTATEAYNYVSSIVQNAIAQHIQEPSWPKQKGQNENHNQVGMAEKNAVPWNEKLNRYIQNRLAIIGDDKERLSDLYTAVTYLLIRHFEGAGLYDATTDPSAYPNISGKVATTATPLHEGLDLASLAKALDVDVSDLSADDVAFLTYSLWSVLDAKIRGNKNPLVEGKRQARDNIIEQIQGKPQQRQQLLNKINSNTDRFVSPSTASKTKNSRSVAIKPNNKKLTHSDDDLYHHGIKDQKWGVRRFQNEDGSLTEAGRERYGISKKDTKWATKNRKKITDAAYKESKRELNEFATQLLKQDNAYKSNGRLSAATINAYNRKMAELMSQKASTIRSPEGRVINFVAKRGEIGVHMALSDAGYDISQLKNGVWDSGRIAYKKKTVDRVEG